MVHGYYFDGTAYIQKPRWKTILKWAIIWVFAVFALLVYENLAGAEYSSAHDPLAKYYERVQQLNPNLPEKKSVEIVRAIRMQAADQGVPFHLALAVAQVESNFDPNAVSPTGALGLFQVIASWHVARTKEAVKSSDRGIMGISENSKIGVGILQEYLARSKTTKEALLRYNGALGTKTAYPDKIIAAMKYYDNI